MIEDGFVLPAPPESAGPIDEDCHVEEPFDIDIAWLRQPYAASVKAYIEAGLLPGRYAGGRLWTERAKLEEWLNDVGHSCNVPGDAAYIP